MSFRLLALLLIARGNPFFCQEPEQAPPPGSATRIDLKHSDPRFSVSLPQGYQQLPALPAGVTYGFYRDVKPGVRVVLTLEILNGRIDPHEPTPAELAQLQSKLLKQLPPGARTRTGREFWGDHEILAQETNYLLQEYEMVALGTQIPILPRAVQITIAGRIEAEAEIRADLKSVLRSFRGTTPWLTPGQRWLAGLSGVSSVLSWLMLLVYGVLKLALYKGGDVLRHWRFRVSYLTVNVAMMALAIASGAAYNASKQESLMSISAYPLIAAILLCAVKTSELYKKGLELRKAGAPTVASA